MRAPNRTAGQPADIAEDMRLVLDQAEAWYQERGEARAPTPPVEIIDRHRAAREQRARFDRLDRWGVPYREALLVMGEDPAGEPFRMDTEPLGFAREFLGAADRGLYNLLVLAGASKGTGKTIAGVYVLEHAEPPLRYGRVWTDAQHPRFVPALELVMGGIYEEGAVAALALAKCKALVIDELGGEFMDRKGLYISLLEWLLNRRYESGGYTVITSNLSMEDFRGRYGERIEDRFKHRALWFDCDGASLRRAPTEV